MPLYYEDPWKSPNIFSSPPLAPEALAKSIWGKDALRDKDLFALLSAHLCKETPQSWERI